MQRLKGFTLNKYRLFISWFLCNDAYNLYCKNHPDFPTIIVTKATELRFFIIDYNPSKRVLYNKDNIHLNSAYILHYNN